MRTLTPSFVSQSASTRPVGPAPTTRTSVCVMNFSIYWLRAQLRRSWDSHDILRQGGLCGPVSSARFRSRYRLICLLDVTMSAVETSRTRNLPSLWRERAVWLLLAVYLALVVRYAWNPTPFAEILAAIGIAGALAHCTLTYGWKNTLAFFAICLVVTFALENVGSLTGALFGRYHFEVGAQLPHVGVIPVIVGPLWFGMGYFAWIVAGTLLGGADRNLDRQLNIMVQPVIAAFVMTQWDFVIDAPASTISRAWIWRDGGAYFGVPLTNFFGWLLTSWTFYQLFALYLASRGEVRPIRRNRALRLAAILFY